MPTDHVAPTLSELDVAIVRSVPAGGNWRDVPHDVPSKRIARIRHEAARGGGSRSTYYGRLRWNEPSYTIATYFNRPGNGCTIHPAADRMLSVREAARLQTFPDEIEFRGPARARHAQVGNAVPPLLAAQVARMFTPRTAVDLFAGAGGLSLGLRSAGHDLLASVDVDAHMVGVLRDAHLAEDSVVRQSDLGDPGVRAVLVESLMEELGGERLGLLAGGPPCQGFSTAGRCDPSDPRNGLLGAFVELALALRPHAVLFENVAALAWRGRAVLNDALRQLGGAGYHCSKALLHAEAYGVPQRRRRLFVVATLGDLPAWPAPWRRTVDPAYRDQQPQHVEDGAYPFTVRDAIADLPLQTAPSADVDVECDPEAPSVLAAWLRGEIEIDELIETSSAWDGRLFV